LDQRRQGAELHCRLEKIDSDSDNVINPQRTIHFTVNKEQTLRAAYGPNTNQQYMNKEKINTHVQYDDDKLNE